MPGYPNATHVSENFTWKETGVNPLKDPADKVKNTIYWCVNVGEPLRRRVGNRPVILTSFYRSRLVQAALWAAELLRCKGNVAKAREKVAPPGNSKHEDAMAGDLIVPGMAPAMVAKYAEGIPAVGGIGVYATFTHLDTRPRINGIIARW